jgi:RNA polymerase sigma-70 factor (ECF subfamily)
MEPTSRNQHLSRISTLWSLVCRAHRSAGTMAVPAQRQMLDRYGGAVRRYLQGAVGNPDAADELFQEFAFRFLHGKLDGADPGRGRFRDFVKGVLFHLIADYHKRLKKRPQALPYDHPDLAVEPASLNDQDREFLTSWRDDLLAKTWAALSEQERQTGQPSYTVLRFRAEHADMQSPQMAEALSVPLGKPLTPAGVRQLLHRAREKFADLLLDEVAQSLDNPTDQQLEEELVNLSLLDYCRPALERRNPSE